MRSIPFLLCFSVSTIQYSINSLSTRHVRCQQAKVIDLNEKSEWRQRRTHNFLLHIPYGVPSDVIRILSPPFPSLHVLLLPSPTGECVRDKFEWHNWHAHIVPMCQSIIFHHYYCYIRIRFTCDSIDESLIYIVFARYEFICESVSVSVVSLTYGFDCDVTIF